MPRLLVALAVVLAVASCGNGIGESRAAQYCALMSDAVGLYAGNPVTHMGYSIGKVDSITPSDDDVKVKFTVSKGQRIPRDTKAIIRSMSILADRALELVGDETSGARLTQDECIPRSQTATPLSISRVIGSATNFVNGINPEGSTNIKDALRDVDEAVKGNGGGLNRLLTNSSDLLNDPDQAILDLGAVVRNVAQLTTMLKANRAPLKEIMLDIPETTPVVVNGVRGVASLSGVTGGLVQIASELEIHLGDDIQLGLDTVGDFLRHLSPHYKGVANFLNPVPRFINTFSSYANNHQFDFISWSPPIFRVATPNGLALCGQMNAAMPGSCADVNGQPHAVDIALLQYVLTEAQRR